MKKLSSDAVRRNLRTILNDMASDGEPCAVERYGETPAVIVPLDWYEKASAALAEKEQES